jgi:hypothetical protein
MSGVDQLMDVSYCVQGAATAPIGVLFRLQVGLEDGIENQHCRHHDHAVADSGNSQRALLSPRLRYVNPPHREWSILLTFQFLHQFVQPSLRSIRRDLLERLIIYSRRATIGFRAFIGKGQYVLPVHLVVQRVEAKVRRFLRFVVQRRLQLLNTFRGC